MPKGVSINQQCGKLEPLLFESHGVAETNFFPPKVSRVMFERRETSNTLLLNTVKP